MIVNYKYGIGDKVKDTISGLEGIITGATYWFNGCIRYQLAPQVMKDGLPVDERSVDEGQLSLIQVGAVVPGNEQRADLKSKEVGTEEKVLMGRTGGPQSSVPSSSR